MRSTTPTTIWSIGTRTALSVFIAGILIISIFGVIFSLQQTSSSASIQSRTGSRGPQGDDGPPGFCNLSSTNETFVAKNLHISELLYLKTNSSVVLHPSNSIIFMDGSDETIVSTISQGTDCVKIEPILCANVIQPLEDSLPQTLANITDEFISVGESLSVEGSIVIRNTSFFRLVEQSPGNTVFQIGGSVPLYLGFISPPLSFNPSTYINVNSSYFIFHSNSTIILETVRLLLANALVDLSNSQITSDLSLLQDLLLVNNSAIYFETTSSSLGVVSDFPSLFTIDGGDFPLFIISSGNQTIRIGTNSSSNAISGNTTFSQFITGPLNLVNRLQFPNSDTSIYNNAGCLTLSASQICLNATNAFNFSTPVSFTLPIVGNMHVNGSLQVNENLLINGSFNLINMTVSNTLTATILSVNSTLVQNVLNVQNGAQIYVDTGGSLVTSSNSFAVFQSSSISFTPPNISAVSCYLPYFSPTSGCVPSCTNHSACTDTFSQLSVTNDLSVLGNIYQQSSANPHPCCTGMGPTNFIYRRFTGSNPTLYNVSSSSDNDWQELSLNFTANDYPTLGNALIFIPYFGGTTLSINTTGQYTIDVEVQVEGVSSAKQIMTTMVCANNVEVFTGPIYQGLNGFSIGGKSVQQISSIWKNKLFMGNSCTFSLFHSNGRLVVNSGRNFTLGVKLENSVF